MAEPQAIHVLLIEDDDDDFFLARRLLLQPGTPRFETSRGATLAEGLERAATALPDLILLDLSLPDSSGWETIRQVRDRLPRLPVILLTGLDDDELGRRAVQEGAQDYLVKGHLDAPLLRRTIRYAIERKKIKDRLEEVIEEVRLRNEELAADLKLARETQLALIPRHFPVIPPTAAPGQGALHFARFYRPCLTVSGDFFSVFPASPTAAGLLICDVMGHGMRSALVTAILRGLLEELKPAAHDPGELLTRLNRAYMAILHQPDQLIFVTALYCLVDSARGTLAAATAGHPAPRLIHNGGGGEVTPVTFAQPQAGPALGLDEEATYAACQLPLHPGDKLLLYTDGITELTNAANEEFGVERLDATLRAGATLPVGELLARIFQAAEAFRGGKEYEDDICLLGVELAKATAAAPPPPPAPGGAGA
ncbi:MAG: SpoIIE family protein phosphatase [Lentisphaeria bacterium]|jgi:sigma-B regulation protein RsbU (phosphoserine phosphatase)